MRAFLIFFEDVHVRYTISPASRRRLYETIRRLIRSALNAHEAVPLVRHVKGRRAEYLRLQGSDPHWRGRVPRRLADKFVRIALVRPAFLTRSFRPRLYSSRASALPLLLPDPPSPFALLALWGLSPPPFTGLLRLLASLSVTYYV